LTKKIAVIGAGWAGCAAAIRLAQDGHQLTLIEASRTLGGRARAVEVHGKILDNGQHIMLGAYTACLELLHDLKIPEKQVVRRLPLQMIYPNGIGMHFLAPRLPAPLHMLIALFFARGLNQADKMALARFSTTCRWIEWRIDHDCTVDELLQRFDQTENLCKLMWRPLCIAALNTASDRASAQVFLNVLRDSLGANRAASDMLIPTRDLSALMPGIAATYIEQHGGTVLTATSVRQITQNQAGQWQLKSAQASELDDRYFDAVVIATPAEQARHLLDSFATSAEQSTPATIPHYDYEPICTCYLQYAETAKLERTFYALLDNSEQKKWGQFVFDRGQLNNEHAGLLAIVISASNTMSEFTHEQIAQDIARQLAHDLQRPELATPNWHQIITEKRATFACTPDVLRPENQTSIPTLLLAGDYTASDYPATLEAAVRSGNMAAKLLIKNLKNKPLKSL
jgi:squalene-associated FAD-dependent desaturase